jgi:hypothetical protein
MGSTLSVRQAELLAIHFENALIMLDGDPAGRSGTEAIADRLRDVSMNTLKPDAHGRTKSTSTLSATSTSISMTAARTSSTRSLPERTFRLQTGFCNPPRGWRSVSCPI